MRMRTLRVQHGCNGRPTQSHLIKRDVCADPAAVRIVTHQRGVKEGK